MNYAVRDALNAIIEEVDDAETSDGQTLIQMGMAFQRIRDNAKHVLRILDNPEITVPQGENYGDAD